MTTKPPVTDGETITYSRVGAKMEDELLAIHRLLYNMAVDREMSREALRAATRTLLVKALRADGTIKPNDVVIDTGDMILWGLNK